MKVRNVKSEVPYWDECNKNNYPWYKKGFYKKSYRKKFIKEQLKQIKQ